MGQILSTIFVSGAGAAACAVALLGGPASGCPPEVLAARRAGLNGYGYSYSEYSFRPAPPVFAPPQTRTFEIREGDYSFDFRVRVRRLPRPLPPPRTFVVPSAGGYGYSGYQQYATPPVQYGGFSGGFAAPSGTRFCPE